MASSARSSFVAVVSTWLSRATAWSWLSPTEYRPRRLAQMASDAAIPASR